MCVRRTDSPDSPGDETEAGALVAAYRHDVHKLRGRSHAAAREECHGVRVNEEVPFGADRDAALLSRPAGSLEQTVSNHESPYRLSMVTGDVAVEAERVASRGDEWFDGLVCSSDPASLHAAWLTSAGAAAFNEAFHYPFTSLKYHVLLTAALVAAYRDGYEFDDLFLVAMPGEEAARDGDAVAAQESEAVTACETVLWSPLVTLGVTPEPDGRPAAWLGSSPARSFADVWSRMSAHPVTIDEERLRMVVDAQLRRIRSWSVALQFVEDFAAWSSGGLRGGVRRRARGLDGVGATGGAGGETGRVGSENGSVNGEHGNGDGDVGNADSGNGDVDGENAGVESETGSWRSGFSLRGGVLGGGGTGGVNGVTDSVNDDTGGVNGPVGAGAGVEGWL